MEKKPKSNADLSVQRHSCAHILAHAIQNIYKNVKFGIGPEIEDGFYYDFEFEKGVKIELSDLKMIEEEMKRIIDQDIEFKQEFMQIDEAEQFFKKLGQSYKVELIKDLKEQGEKEVSIYKSGDFIDLCRGPHVEKSRQISEFKLYQVAGAYWKGMEKNKMLVRIYGVLFSSKNEIENFLKEREDAEKFSHRKIGKEMKLFAIFDEIGAGLPVWLPNGYAMRRVLEEYLLNLDRKYGYVHVLTPHIHKKEMFERSGHLNFYKESMYAPMKIEDHEYYLKPMNCPAGMMIYKMEKRSYKDLPIKMGELGTVYRYEKSGELLGLQRVRGFTQNDAHIFCSEDQLEGQFLEVFEMLMKFYKDIGFKKFSFVLALSDPNAEKFKFCGTKEEWHVAEEKLRQFVKKAGVPFKELIGDAAFYGPKLDINAVNVYGKEFGVSTIQIDFNLPERFDISFVDKDGKEKRPYVIHRALVGSFERFFGFLIEFYRGNFPLWFAPEQVEIIPVSEKLNDYAQKVQSEILSAGYERNIWIRSKINIGSGGVSAKIRSAVLHRLPYIVVVGEKEQKERMISLRIRGKKDQISMKLEQFCSMIIQKVSEKSLDL